VAKEEQLTEEEIELFELLYEHIHLGSQKHVSKIRAIKLRDAWNRFNEPKDTYCMCSAYSRIAKVRNYLKWYEKEHR